MEHSRYEQTYSQSTKSKDVELLEKRIGLLEKEVKLALDHVQRLYAAQQSLVSILQGETDGR